MHSFIQFTSLGLFLWIGRIIGDPLPIQITDKWLVDIRTVVSVLGVVLFGVWWISRWMRTVEVSLKSGHERFDDIERRMDRRDELIAQLKTTIDQLPCSQCNPNLKRKHE